MLERPDIEAAITSNLEDVEVITKNLTDADLAAAPSIPAAWRNLPEMDPAEALQAALQPWKNIPGTALERLISVIESSGAVALIKTQASRADRVAIALAYVILNEENEPRIFVGHPPTNTILTFPRLQPLPSDIIAFYTTVHDSLIIAPYANGAGPGLVPATDIKSWQEENDEDFNGSLDFEFDDDLPDPPPTPESLVNLWSPERYPRALYINLQSPNQVFDMFTGDLIDATENGRDSALTVAAKFFLGFVRHYETVEKWYPIGD